MGKASVSLRQRLFFLKNNRNRKSRDLLSTISLMIKWYSERNSSACSRLFGGVERHFRVGNSRTRRNRRLKNCDDSKRLNFYANVHSEESSSVCIVFEGRIPTIVALNVWEPCR